MKQRVQQVIPTKSPCKHQFYEILTCSNMYSTCEWMHKLNMEFWRFAVKAQFLRSGGAQQWLLLHLSKCGPEVSGPICCRPEHWHCSNFSWQHQRSGRSSLGFFGELPHSSLLCAEYESLKRRPQFAPRQIFDWNLFLLVLHNSIQRATNRRTQLISQLSSLFENQAECCPTTNALAWEMWKVRSSSRLALETFDKSKSIEYKGTQQKIRSTPKATREKNKQPHAKEARGCE